MTRDPGSTHIEFVEIPLFATSREGLISDDELRSVENELLEKPDRGSLQRDTGGVRKLRVGLGGGGKSGGARVAYLYVEVRDTIYFLLAFPKNVQANLTADQKKRLRKLVETLKREG